VIADKNIGANVAGGGDGMGVAIANIWYKFVWGNSTDKYSEVPWVYPQDVAYVIQDDWTQWPCPSWFHIPSTEEWNWISAGKGYSRLVKNLYLPFHWVAGYWTSNQSSDTHANAFYTSTENVTPTITIHKKLNPLGIRCFKNEA
jgi:hypothetical protein